MQSCLRTSQRSSHVSWPPALRLLSYLSFGLVEVFTKFELISQFELMLAVGFRFVGTLHGFMSVSKLAEERSIRSVI